MQCAIDNAKRTFDVDLVSEIDRISKDMDIKSNGYPKFWTIIRKQFNKNRVNNELVCPMNYIFDIKLPKYKSSKTTLPMDTFFVKYEMDENRRKSKRVEELIQKYSFELYDFHCNDNMSNYNVDDYILLRNDFDELIKDIRSTYISKNYIGLMSWLIDRAFCISIGSKRNRHVLQSTINKNKSLLLKVLYDINPEALLLCFSKNMKSINCEK